MNDGRIRWVLALLAVLAWFPGGAGAERSGEPGVVHTVFLWLKEPRNAQHRQQLLQASERLRVIPGVVDIRFGEAIESERDIVDDSFDIGIYFYFVDLAAMNAYLVHPVHQTVVQQQLKPLVERIVVHDFHDTGGR